MRVREQAGMLCLVVAVCVTGAVVTGGDAETLAAYSDHVSVSERAGAGTWDSEEASPPDPCATGRPARGGAGHVNEGGSPSGGGPGHPPGLEARHGPDDDCAPDGDPGRPEQPEQPGQPEQPEQPGGPESPGEPSPGPPPQGGETVTPSVGDREPGTSPYLPGSGNNESNTSPTSPVDDQPSPTTPQDLEVSAPH